MDHIKIVNLTPHPITVCEGPYAEQTYDIPPSGEVARVSTSEEFVFEDDGMDFVRRTFGKVTGIPEPKENTLYAVSSLVFEKSDRKDLIVPDTGSTAIRDKNGRIVAITRWICK
jgi:hypothetical protein